MAEMPKGGAKGEPGKYLERHSRGRGQINKATRTLWRVAFTFTTAMPIPKTEKDAEKRLFGFRGVNKCAQASTATVYGRVHQSANQS